MASIRDIKLRVNSIESTQQITKAMKLVSTAKLQKAKSRVEATRPFFQYTKKTIASIMKMTTDLSLPMCEVREGGKKAYLVITSDRGLAGGYNSNVCKLVHNAIEDKENVVIFAVGKKAKDYFGKRGYEIKEVFEGITENPEFAKAEEIGEKLINDYINEEFNQLLISYTMFQSTLNQVPTLTQILPIKTEDFEVDDVNENSEIMNYEPSAEAVLSQIIPKFIYSTIFGATVESAASEHGARMTAMESATSNAEDMISSLTLEYNRARQAAITQEISEIVGGAEALK